MLNRLRTFLVYCYTEIITSSKYNFMRMLARQSAYAVSLEGNTQAGVISIAWGLGVLDYRERMPIDAWHKVRSEFVTRAGLTTNGVALLRFISYNFLF
jgi:hypothetical protein